MRPATTSKKRGGHVAGVIMESLMSLSPLRPSPQASAPAGGRSTYGLNTGLAPFDSRSRRAKRRSVDDVMSGAPALRCSACKRCHIRSAGRCKLQHGAGRGLWHDHHHFLPYRSGRQFISVVKAIVIDVYAFDMNSSPVTIKSYFNVRNSVFASIVIGILAYSPGIITTIKLLSVHKLIWSR